MARRSILLALLIGAVAVAVFAQGTAPRAEPVAEVDVAAPGLLAFMPGEPYLVVADGAVLQLYDLADVAQPEPIASLTLDTPPAALTAASDFALAATDAGELLVLAPDPFSATGYGLVNALPIPAAPRRIVLAADQRWGIAAGADGYVTLRIDNASNIERSAVVETGDAPVVDAALGGSGAYLVRAGQADVERLPLSTNRAVTRASTRLRFDAQPVAVALSADGLLLAVALEDGRIVLLDTDTLEAAATLDLDDDRADQIALVEDGDTRYLVATSATAARVVFADVSDPAAIGEPGRIAPPPDTTTLATAALGRLIALQTGDALLLYELTAP